MPVTLRPLPAQAPAGPGMRQSRHLLVVGAEVEAEEVELLALSRFPTTRWEVPPTPGRDGVLEPGLLRTSRHTALRGPYASNGGRGGSVFVVSCPRERGEPPFPGGGDRDGLGRAFPAGLPVREEDRVVRWLVAAARRLAGTAVLDGVVVTPDPDAQIDLTVYSDVWLEPEAALATARHVDARTVYAPGGEDWAGPPAHLVSPADLDAADAAELHAAADDVDIAALTSPEALSGYALHLPLGLDGLVVVEIGGEELLPVSLRGLPWADGGAIAYRVRWVPDDFTELEEERPPTAHRIARGRAAISVAKLTGALHDVVGGEIADQGEFLVARSDL